MKCYSFTPHSSIVSKSLSSDILPLSSTIFSIKTKLTQPSLSLWLSFSLNATTTYVFHLSLIAIIRCLYFSPILPWVLSESHTYLPHWQHPPSLLCHVLNHPFMQLSTCSCCEFFPKLCPSSDWKTCETFLPLVHCSAAINFVLSVVFLLILTTSQPFSVLGFDRLFIHQTWPNCLFIVHIFVVDGWFFLHLCCRCNLYFWEPSLFFDMV